MLKNHKSSSIADLALFLQIDALNLEHLVPTKYLPKSISFESRLMKVKSRSSQSSLYVIILAKTRCNFQF